MKRCITLIAFIALATGVFAQVPEKLNFQAIVRNVNGELLKNSDVGFRIQILQSGEFGAAVYVETHQAVTNENGLATLQIGNGNPVTGTFADIDWSEGPYYIKLEIDPIGGTNYSIAGTQQLLSVPYALYAREAGLPEGMVRILSQAGEGDILWYDGAEWKPLQAGADGQVLTLVNGKPEWRSLPTGNDLIELHEPVLSIVFEDDSYNHTLHIATDGNYFYTCNGGNYMAGRINKFTLSGDSVTSYPIQIDMRGLMYNNSDGLLYASGFEASTAERNIYKITNLQNGTFEKALPNSYDNYQSATGISSGGDYFYAFNKGTLKQYKISDGSLVNTFEDLNYGNFSGADGSVAVDPDHIYTWDPSTGTVYVYSLEGDFQQNLKLPNGNYGFSISYANGYLFVATDANYGIGTWYGYNIRKMINPTRIVNNLKVLSEKKSVAEVAHDDTTVH